MSQHLALLFQITLLPQHPYGYKVKLLLETPPSTAGPGFASTSLEFVKNRLTSMLMHVCECRYDDAWFARLLF